MRKNRILDSDVLEFVKKGEQKAIAIIATAPRNYVERQDYLEQQFNFMAGSTEKILENFDLEKFKKRENYRLPSSQLRIMLLGAFQAVACLERLENHIVRPNSDITAFGAKIKLIHAVGVYTSNGQNDPASLCALRMFSGRQPVKGEMKYLQRRCA